MGNPGDWLLLVDGIGSTVVGFLASAVQRVWSEHRAEEREELAAEKAKKDAEENSFRESVLMGLRDARESTLKLSERLLVVETRSATIPSEGP